MKPDRDARIHGFLGLCARAGQLFLGQDACVEAVRKQNAALVLMDGACSANTRKRLTNACHTHGIPLFDAAGGFISQATGRDGVKVAAVKPGGMGEKMLNLINEPRGPEASDRGLEPVSAHKNHKADHIAVNAGVQGVQ